MQYNRAFLLAPCSTPYFPVAGEYTTFQREASYGVQSTRSAYATLLRGAGLAGTPGLGTHNH